MGFEIFYSNNYLNDYIYSIFFILEKNLIMIKMSLETVLFKKFLNKTLNNIKNNKNEEKDVHFTYNNSYSPKIFII